MASHVVLKEQLLEMGFDEKLMYVEFYFKSISIYLFFIILS